MPSKNYFLTEKQIGHGAWIAVRQYYGREFEAGEPVRNDPMCVWVVPIYFNYGDRKVLIGNGYFDFWGQPICAPKPSQLYDKIQIHRMR